MTASHTSTVGLLLRLRRDVRGASLAMATLVLVICALAVAGPLLFAATASHEARQTLASGPPSGRSLVAHPDVVPETGPSSHGRPAGWSATVAGQYGGFADRLADVRSSFPEMVRAGTGHARWTITLSGIPLSASEPAARPPGATTKLSLKVDPEARHEVRLVAGTWPEDRSYYPRGTTSVALSVESATAMGWHVGQVRAGYVLSGTWSPRDPRADYWSLNTSMVHPFVFDDGNSRVVITGTAFVSPMRWTASVESAQTAAEQVWYPLRLDRLGGDDLSSYVSQVRRLTGTASAGSDDTSFTLTAAGLPELEAAEARAQAARSVITLAAVGPAGALLLVLVLGVRGFGLRRRTTLALLTARGASPARLRSLLGLEWLLIAVPAAVVAVAAVWLTLRVPPTRSGILVAGLVVVLPVLLLVRTPLRSSGARERADSRVRRDQPWSRLAGVGIVALAAASTYLLMSSGLGASGGSVDVLVVAAPLLLSAAAAVVVLALYPLPLRRLSRRLARGRSTIGWLGSLRSLRDPGVQVAPVLTVLVAVAMAVFSVVMVATVRQGAERSALVDTGAQLRLDGPIVDDATYARVLRVDGVADAARVEEVGSIDATVAGSTRSVDLYLADLRALARVQSHVPGGIPDPPRSPGAVISRGLGSRGDSVRFGIPSTQVGVTTLARRVPGIASSGSWLLVDAAGRGGTSFVPHVLLVSLDAGADPTAVGRRLGKVVGSGGRLSVAADATRVRLGDPLVRALTRFLLVSVVVVALAAVASVVLALAMGARARRRHLMVLRVLGVPRSRRRWYAVWEQAPPVLVSLLVGAALGSGLAFAVHAVIDLSPFTGSGGQPALAWPAGLLAFLLGGYAVLVALAIVAGTWWSERYGGAAVLRWEEE